MSDWRWRALDRAPDGWHYFTSTVEPYEWWAYDGRVQLPLAELVAERLRLKRKGDTAPRP